MGFSRIKAVYIEDTVETDDVIVFDIFINSDNSARAMEVFGYSIDDGEKWPFTVRFKSNEGLLSWGPGGDDTSTTINIFQKKITIGEYITRVDIFDGEKTEYTYRITDIFEWGQLR